MKGGGGRAGSRKSEEEIRAVVGLSQEGGGTGPEGGLAASGILHRCINRRGALTAKKPRERDQLRIPTIIARCLIFIPYQMV